jgi:hypothetical protein
MIDIKRTFYTWSDTQNVATGYTVSEEGQGLVAVMENGVENVMPSAGLAGEVFVGFAMFRQQTFTTAAVVEDHVVPTAAPYLVELSKNNLITGQIRVYDATNDVDLTPAAAPPAVAAGEYLVDLVAGTVELNAAEAGVTIRVYFRYEMTAAEAILHYYEAPTNHPDPNYFAQVGVGKGKGRVFTMYYDQAIDWSTAALIPYLAADGMITGAGPGPAIPSGRVVSVPSPADPYLGIEFLI